MLGLRHAVALVVPAAAKLEQDVPWQKLTVAVFTQFHQLNAEFSSLSLIWFFEFGFFFFFG